MKESKAEFLHEAAGLQAASAALGLADPLGPVVVLVLARRHDALGGRASSGRSTAR